jgi:hypothetical protein
MIITGYGLVSDLSSARVEYRVSISIEIIEMSIQIDEVNINLPSSDDKKCHRPYEHEAI